MLGFSPLASAPIGDNGGIEGVHSLSFDNITATPVVDTATVFEDETIPAADITAGVPVVDNANVIVVYNFGANDISTTPVVDSIAASIISNFAPQEITSGTPVVDDITAAVISNFAPVEIALSAPTVDSATVSVISNFFPVALEPQPIISAFLFFQEYALTVVDITAGVPTLPARFTWDYQEPLTDSWTEQADDDSVWSTQADSSDTWTEATEPTDIWTDVTDPTDTWSEAAQETQMAISITKPQVGADADSWGTKLNLALDALVDAHNGVTATTPNLETGWEVNGVAITASSDELNKLDGLTASTDELNKMDGVTVTSTKINYLSDVTSNIQAQIDAAAGSGGTTYTANTTYGTTLSGTEIRMHTSYGAGNWSVSNGSFTASGNITAYSDERLKDNIRTVDNALGMVSDMRGVFYDKDGEAGVGVIAQEMQKVLPEVVMDGEYLSVSYGNIVGVLIEAVKELKAQVEELKHGSTNQRRNIT